MEICIISINYPTEQRQIHVFLDNLVKQFVDRGITCNVIAPQSSYSYYKCKDLRREFVSNRLTEKGNKYIVYSPLFTVYPTVKVGDICLSDLSRKSFYKAALNVYLKNDFNADLIYSHFFQAGISAVMLGKRLGIPVFIANGEADTIAETRFISRKLMSRTLVGATGIISVSTKCKEEVGILCGNEKSIMRKIMIIPNAANHNRFFVMNREECRKQLGYPSDAFIIAFTGSFIERKGVSKVARAVDAIDGASAIFIGTGPEVPKCKNMLHCGRVKNDEMAMYLNAADVFVLPTQAEGCCNAIVEAVCCGLPVISSDRSFNWDILDESCAVLIDPNSQDEIENAILKIKKDKCYRMKLAEGSCQKSKDLSLEYRVEKILDFITK